jgi:protein arginine kinase activator
MKCDVCEKEATVFLTQIINGQMTTVNLCEGCSKAKGVTDEMGFGLAEAFLGPAQPATAKHAGAEDVTCPACGFTQAQLKKIGRMGCPECYSTFRDGLDSLLKAMHKGTKHIGKVPHRLVIEGQVNDKLSSLRDELATAVSEERYEDAARLKADLEKAQKKAAKSAG